MSQHFLKPYEHSDAKVKVELDLSNYVTKADSKGATRVDTSNLAAKPNLASLNSEVDKTDIDTLKTVAADLYNLCNVVDKDVTKRMCMIN